MDNENNIRNIVKEIMRELNKQSIKIHENFVSYYVRLLSLNPKWYISMENITDRDHIHNFIKYVVDRLKTQNVPNMVTLKIQLYFSCNFDNKQAIIIKHRHELLQRLYPLRNSIVDTDVLYDKADVDKLFKKIVYYTTLASGLGNPTMDLVFIESLSALKSVLFESELKEFVGLSNVSKEEQLAELIKLVSGVRLFNKDCGKGGEGIEDLPALLDGALDAIKFSSHKMLLATMEKVNLFTTAVDNSYRLEVTESHVKLFLDIPMSVIDSDIEFIKDLLLLYRQYELFLRKIITEVDKIEERTKSIFKNLQEKFKILHETVYMRIAIPAHQVFPQFEQISETWYQLQNQALLLAKLNKVLLDLEIYVNTLHFDETIIDTLVGEEGALTDAARLARTDNVLKSKNPEVFILQTNYYDCIEKFKLQYLGFCCWMLVKTRGGLIPGNPNIGVVKYRGKNFAFSSCEAGKIFTEDPKELVLQTLELVRKKPALINFLQIKQQLLEVQHIQHLVEEVVESKLVSDVALQTDVHPIQTKIDLKYKWNVWDLKREAIQLANLSKCRTVSTQTYKTLCKCPVRTQTYSYKDKEIQTKQDNYTNVPKRSNFIFGLRGRKDDKQFIIELTRPVNE